MRCVLGSMSESDRDPGHTVPELCRDVMQGGRDVRQAKKDTEDRTLASQSPKLSFEASSRVQRR